MNRGVPPTPVGALVPWANMAVEAELHRVTGPRVSWHYSRLVPSSRTTELDARFLTGLLSAVPGALAQLAALPLSRVYLACTSAAFMNPELTEEISHVAAGVSVLSAFEAITAALTHLSARSVVLLTPYPDNVTAQEAAMLAEAGFAVTAKASLGLDDCYGLVTHEQIWELIRSVDHAKLNEADAVVLSCTGWPTFDLIPEMRRCLGKTVISSNTAIGLHALRGEDVHASRARS
jgi:maleate isomerase